MSRHEGRGSPIEVSAEQNCAKCELRDKCRDSRKSKKFACTFFVVEDDSKKLDKSSREFRKMMRELVSSESVLSDSYNIDDRDVPLAPNFYRWCVGEKFLAASPPPYPWQLEVGLHLFGDICPNPKCSDSRWYAEIPHDCDVGEIPERLSLRRRGVCPKCKKTRLDYINEGREKDYNSYVGTVGQRCITGDSIVSTTRGLTRIADWARGLAPGWNYAPFYRRGRKMPLSVIGENGNPMRVDRIWVSKPERIFRVSIRGGLEIAGTADHPIMLKKGWTKLSDVVEGDVLPVYYGQRVWGTKRKVSTDLARFLGFWVSEGSGSTSSVHVTNYDDDVRNLCRREMLKLSPGAKIVERARAGADPSLSLKRCVGSKDRLLYSRVDNLVDGLWRKSADKVVPRVVLESPEDVVCAFLQALFEGDGSVSTSAVGYASLSKQLVMQVKVLLANLGIPSSIRRRMSWATNGTPQQASKPYWCLGIKGPALSVFQERVGFFSVRKATKLARAVERHSRRDRRVPTWYEMYPECIKREYVDLIRKIDGEWSQFESTGVKGFTSGHVSFRYEVADWRRLLSSNVGLSQTRLDNYWSKLRSSGRWHDLSQELRIELLTFHDRYLRDNCYWTVVKKVRRSKKLRKTYDFHVPVHHKFMANGLLNHNSGKCLVGSTLVQTPEGLVPMRSLRVGQRVVVDGGEYAVLGSSPSGRKPVVELTTKRGVVLKLTADHKLLGPDGWVEARNAKSVLLQAYDLPWGTATQFSGPPDPRGKHLAQRLCTLTREAAIEEVHRAVYEESVSGTRAVLHTYSSRHAAALQQYLLTKRIVSSRVGDKVVLEHPWSVRYADTFGIRSERVEYVVRNSAAAHEQRIGEDACKSLYATLQTVEVIDQWHDPSTLRTAAEYRSVCAAGEMTREDAAACADAYEKLQPKDALLRHFAVQRLRSYARADLDWDEVVSVELAGREETYDIEVESVHRFAANGVVAHNSSGLGFVWSYHTHSLIKLKNPSAFYGIKAGTILHMNMIGLTYTGVKQAVWDPFMTTMSEAPWFKVYHEVLDETARRVGEEELYRIKDGFVFYKPPSLWLAPSSPSRRNLRGRTRVFAGVDEMGHFSESTDKVNISGLEVWRALTRSLSTVRPAVRRLRKRGVVNVPPAIAVSISSPWEISDPQMQLYNAAERQGSTYAMMRPTWEANPDITFEDLEDEFALDPLSAWRDYGCRPPYSAKSFVNGLDPFKRCIDRKMRSAVTQRTVSVRPKTKSEAKRQKGVAVSAKLRFRWEDVEVPKIMALDAGKHKNAFAVCVAHLDTDGRLVYDAFVEVRPRHNRPVSFTRVYKNVLLPLAKQLNVVVTVSDRWQQEKIVEDLAEDAGTEHFNHQLKYGEFIAWRDDLLQEQLVIPRPEKKVREILHIEGPEEAAFDDTPVSQFIRQSIRVVDVPGKTVDKPSVGNDDVFRVGVLAHAGAQLPEVVELLTNGNVGRRGDGGVGAVSTVGMGGGGAITQAGNSGVASTASSVGSISR